MKKIQFFGAAGEVTGSCFLLTGTSNQILIDLGLFQGKDDDIINQKKLSFDARNVSAVLVTHAHLDHCGRLPLLLQNGFTGKIFTTAPTKDIINISLLDTVAIAQEEKKQALFTKEEVEKIIQNMQEVEYDKTFSVEEFTIAFRNAGHILGSSSIEISDGNKTIVFSGDLGNTPQDLIQPTESINKANFVVMESTYGNTTHPKEDVNEILQKEINTVEHGGGTLLIPAFSIERTQELLHRIHLLKQEKKIQEITPIFLDSPMAIAVTEIFKKYPQYYNNDIKQEKNPFDFPNLITTTTAQESKDILKVESPKVIIAGSGMMSGGRILHHLKNNLALPTTRLLIVGYQATNTLGRLIIDGKNEVTIYNEIVPIRATITRIQALSSHADQPKLLHWLSTIKNVEKVFLVHGDTEQRTTFANILQEKGYTNVFLPNISDAYEID